MEKKITDLSIVENGYLRFLFLELPFQSTILFSQVYELLPDINNN